MVLSYDVIFAPPNNLKQNCDPSKKMSLPFKSKPLCQINDPPSQINVPCSKKSPLVK